MIPTELTADYYLLNFQTLLNAVDLRYRDLLSKSESDWLQTINHLPPNAQMLYVRLLSRKGRYFRRDKLSYPEIENLDNAAEALKKADFIEINNPCWVCDDIAPLFSKPELLAQFPFLAPDKSARKAILLKKLSARSPKFDEFGQTILHIRHQQHLNTFLLLFFGNSHQDLSQFVLADLGLHQFESYSIDLENRLFQHRHQIESWLQLTELADLYWQAKEQKDQATIITLANRLPAAYEWTPLERKRQKLINNIARDFERFDLLSEALTLFEQSYIPPARERRVRILDKLQRYDEALSLVQEIKQSAMNEEEAESALILEKKLCRLLKRPFQPRRKPEFQQNYLTLPYSEQRIEHAVAEHYAKQGWAVYYLENALLCGLFGLAFWDIIFTSVPGAFLNPYQRSPCDMFRPEFCEQRATLIQKRLADIESDKWSGWMDVYEKKYGLSNDWVNWHVLNKEAVSLAIHAISGKTLRHLFERMLFDLRNNRSGFPDLIMFKGSQYQWVEVKGPGDKLQNNQARWLNIFHELDIPAHIDFVTWYEN